MIDSNVNDEKEFQFDLEMRFECAYLCRVKRKQIVSQKQPGIMHKIFIPVTEFIANGGIINDGRVLYINMDTGRFTSIGKFQNITKKSPKIITVTGGPWATQYHADMLFIQIEVQPIYK